IRQAIPGSPAEQVTTASVNPPEPAAPGSARHRPVAGLTRLTPPRSGTIRHRDRLSAHVRSSTSVPLTAPHRETARHLLWIRTVPSGRARQVCAALPLHAARSTGLPLILPFPRSSRHRPGSCDATGPAGSVHCWAACPVHALSRTRVPFLVLPPGSARHRPDPGLISRPRLPASHCCAALPLQDRSSARAPLAMPGAARHLPWIRSVSSCTAVHCSAAPPLHRQMFTGVPPADRLPASCRHLPPLCRRTCPVAPLSGARRTRQLNETDPMAPPEPVAVTRAR